MNRKILVTHDQLILLNNLFNEVPHGLEASVLSQSDELKSMWKEVESCLNDNSAETALSYVDEKKSSVVFGSFDLVEQALNDNDFHARVGFSKAEAISLLKQLTNNDGSAVASKA